MELLFALVVGDAHTGLTDIIPCAPCKIANAAGQRLHLCPKPVDLWRVCLCPGNHPVGILGQIHGVPAHHVVVAAQIQM